MGLRSANIVYEFDPRPWNGPGSPQKMTDLKFGFRNHILVESSQKFFFLIVFIFISVSFRHLRHHFGLDFVMIFMTCFILSELWSWENSFYIILIYIIERLERQYFWVAHYYKHFDLFDAAVLESELNGFSKKILIRQHFLSKTLETKMHILFN